MKKMKVGQLQLWDKPVKSELSKPEPKPLNPSNQLPESDDSDSLQPDYVKHRKKLGYKLDDEQLKLKAS